jgi:hypothetical protein
VARQESHRRTSHRGMHSRSRSSIQSPERERHATTGNLTYEHTSAHVEQPLVEGIIRVPESSSPFDIGNVGQNNRVLNVGAGFLDTAVHMNLGSLKPFLIPYVAGDDRIREILDYRQYRLNNRDGHVSILASGRISEYANPVRSRTPMRFF